MSARNSKKAREICLSTHSKTNKRGGIFMVCHCCGLPFNPATTKWRADHIRRHAEGGEETADNLWPIMLRCDAGKDGKAANDTKEIAHGKRAGAKHFGIERKSGFRKPPNGFKHRFGGGLRRIADD